MSEELSEVGKMEGKPNEITAYSVLEKPQKSFCYKFPLLRTKIMDSDEIELSIDLNICRENELLYARTTDQKLQHSSTIFELLRLLSEKTKTSETSTTIHDTHETEEIGSIDYQRGSQSMEEFSLRSQSDSNSWTVMGLTLLRNKLFVAIGTRKFTVEVYDRRNLKFKYQWKSRRLNRVHDIKGCDINNCLYFMNETEQENEIVKYEANGDIMTSWSVGDSFGQLSITDEANVLFTPWKKDQLVEYSPEGQVLRVISLRKFGSTSAWHAIKLSTDNYLVSHVNDADQQARLSIIDGEGDVLKCYGSEDQQLKCPVYLEKDRNENIIVVDSGLSCVTVLDSNLAGVNSKLYKTKQEICLKVIPQKAIVDEEHGTVFIVEDLFRKCQQGSERKFEKETYNTLTCLKVAKM